MGLYIVAIVILILMLILRANNHCQKATVKTPGVYCVGKNIFRYTAANDLAFNLGARLATPREVMEACHKGCHWNVLGWCDGFRAYSCREGEFRGGSMPGQLKLGAYIYGYMPSGQVVKEMLIH